MSKRRYNPVQAKLYEASRDRLLILARKLHNQRIIKKATIAEVVAYLLKGVR